MFTLTSMEHSLITPAEYEHVVAEHFAALGYRTTVTTYSNDYGLDVLAQNSDERVAVQAKLYGHTSRQINRQMVMELHGVCAYFDCDRAVLATDGNVRADAQEVAQKLGVSILRVEPRSPSRPGTRSVIAPASPPEHGDAPAALTAEGVWSRYVMPLAGQTLQAQGDRTNKIVRVDWSGIERITSSGSRSRIDYEIFRLAINQILQTGFITRDEINQNYAKRASSGIVLILAQIPLFRLERSPLRLVLKVSPP